MAGNFLRHTGKIETSTQKINDMFSDIVYHKLTPAPNNPTYNYQGFRPGVTVLEKGHVKQTGSRCFSTSVVFHRDMTVTLRDGVAIYADLFRPTNSDAVPTIIIWSPYGKTGSGYQNYNTMAPFRAGYAQGEWSGYEKFEGLDPAEWCRRGYAILNVDARGAGDSGGNIAMWGLQEAEDIYDTIDFISRCAWSNGSVAMAGNSWLAIAQVNFVSRLSHPALKAIAPWEALNDPYKHWAARGGFPYVPKFHQILKQVLAGPGSLESIADMLETRPLYDEYWEAKRLPIENICDIPMYIVASYSSMLHTPGAFQTFQRAKTDKKWLRIHPYQEWYDLYRPDMIDDLQRFFDHYCYGIDNNWARDTSPVRLSLLGFEADGSASTTIIERPEQTYPLTRENMRALYLDAFNMTLSISAVERESTVQYEAHSLDATVDFTTFFHEYTEIAGYSKLKVYMACPDHDDLDVVCQIRKLDATGRPLAHLNYPSPVSFEETPNANTIKTLGPQGFLRASHAISLEPTRSEGNDVFYSHKTRQPIRPGEIVCLEIPIWPMGMVFAAGEGIMLRISGHDMCANETDLWDHHEPNDQNVGSHIVYTGGEYPSVLVMPVIS